MTTDFILLIDKIICGHLPYRSPLCAISLSSAPPLFSGTFMISFAIKGSDSAIKAFDSPIKAYDSPIKGFDCKKQHGSVLSQINQLDLTIILSSHNAFEKILF